MIFLKKCPRTILTWTTIEVWRIGDDDNKGVIIVAWHPSNTKNTPMELHCKTN